MAMKRLTDKGKERASGPNENGNGEARAIGKTGVATMPEASLAAAPISRGRLVEALCTHIHDICEADNKMLDRAVNFLLNCPIVKFRPELKIEFALDLALSSENSLCENYNGFGPRMFQSLDERLSKMGISIGMPLEDSIRAGAMERLGRKIQAAPMPAKGNADAEKTPVGKITLTDGNGKRVRGTDLRDIPSCARAKEGKPLEEEPGTRADYGVATPEEPDEILVSGMAVTNWRKRK